MIRMSCHMKHVINDDICNSLTRFTNTFISPLRWLLSQLLNLHLSGKHEWLPSNSSLTSTNSSFTPVNSFTSFVAMQAIYQQQGSLPALPFSLLCALTPRFHLFLIPSCQILLIDTGWRLECSLQYFMHTSINICVHMVLEIKYLAGYVKERDKFLTKNNDLLPGRTAVIMVSGLFSLQDQAYRVLR